jgi:hypothetical protein
VTISSIKERCNNIFGCTKYMRKKEFLLSNYPKNVAKIVIN